MKIAVQKAIILQDIGNDMISEVIKRENFSQINSQYLTCCSASQTIKLHPNFTLDKNWCKNP